MRITLRLNRRGSLKASPIDFLSDLSWDQMTQLTKFENRVGNGSMGGPYADFLFSAKILHCIFVLHENWVILHKLKIRNYIFQELLLEWLQTF
jgi:hypothetical protein